MAVRMNRSTTASPLSSSAISLPRDRRRCLIASGSWNLNPLFCSSACWIDCVSKDKRNRVGRKSIGEFTVNSSSRNQKRVTSSVASSNNGLNFNSIFVAPASWKRIFFASKKVRSIILLNLSSLIYASNISVVKEVEAITDPGVFNVMRFTLAAIPFIPIVLLARDDGHSRRAGMELGFWASLGYILQAVGLLTSDAGRASFISMLTVIVVPVIDAMLGSSIPARTWFGGLMCIFGVGMLESSGSTPCVGDLLNFLSAVSFGIHMLRTEHISRNTRKEDVLPLLGYEVCIVALVSIIWYFIEGRCGVQEFNPATWKWDAIFHWISSFPWIPALYTGSFSTGVCLWVEMVAMCDVSATETAIIYGLEPVWGAGFAWFLLGERWGVLGWMGAAFVLGGSLTVQMMGTGTRSSSSSSSRECKRMDAGSDKLS
ncbi:uncharacterized protein LOC127263691 [Andrographis paniculata]|uniref:uncharacterized protein LOC127263691 n=1 Tax=Andrographis paniculata TaxID=175694 RepID=UPI0021E710C7|nr:uncharacterized protein LOC127263691 [Andrographis paniculata]